MTQKKSITGFTYRPSKRVVARIEATGCKHPSGKSSGRFTYRPRRVRLQPRMINRRVLIAACTEEVFHGGGLPRLYAALLVRAIAAVEPDLADEFHGALAVLDRGPD